MRVDVFQDNYGFWRARRGEAEIGPQRHTRDEALGDMEGLYQNGDFVAAEGVTHGSSIPAVPIPTPAAAAAAGVAAGTGPPQHLPAVSMEENPGSIGPLIPA